MPQWPTHDPKLTLERLIESTSKSKPDLAEMYAEAEMWHYLEPPLTMDPPPEASKEERGFSEVRHRPSPLDDSSRPLFIDEPGFGKSVGKSSLINQLSWALDGRDKIDKIIPVVSMDPPEASKEERGFPEEVRHHPNPLDDSSGPLVVMDSPGFVETDDKSREARDFLSRCLDGSLGRSDKIDMIVFVVSGTSEALRELHDIFKAHGDIVRHVIVIFKHFDDLSRPQHKSMMGPRGYVRDVLTCQHDYLKLDGDHVGKNLCEEYVADLRRSQVAKIGAELRSIGDDINRRYMRDDARRARLERPAQFSSDCDAYSLGVSLWEAWSVLAAAHGSCIMSKMIQGDPCVQDPGYVNEYSDTSFCQIYGEYSQSVHKGEFCRSDQKECFSFCGFDSEASMKVR